MNSLRLPGRLENPRSCSHLSPLFLFHSSPFARVLSPPPRLTPSSGRPFFRASTLSISFRSARTFRRRRRLSSRLLCSDIPLIFLSRSHSLTISFYSFRSLADQLRKLLKPLVAVENYLLSSSCRSIVMSSSSSVTSHSFRYVNILSSGRYLSSMIGDIEKQVFPVMLDSFRLSYLPKRAPESGKSDFNQEDVISNW